MIPEYCRQTYHCGTLGYNIEHERHLKYPLLNYLKWMNKCKVIEIFTNSMWETAVKNGYMYISLRMGRTDAVEWIGSLADSRLSPG